MKTGLDEILQLNLKAECRTEKKPGSDEVALTDGTLEYEVQGLAGLKSEVDTLLQALNGARPYSEVRKDLAKKETADAIATALYECGLATANNSATDFVSGTEALGIIEDEQFALLYKILYKNRFWIECQDPQRVPRNVLFGMGIENYHFLYRESWFDTPVLSYLGDEKARLAMNRFYGEEYGHDELIYQSITQLGITRDNVRDVQPLPQTLALCNCLAHWAATDPLFFFTTLGVLEGKDPQIDTYITTMEKSDSISREFITPIRKHALINLEGEHGSLTAEIFSTIDVVQKTDLQRMLNKTRLFIELYDEFFKAVWDYYSKDKNPLVRWNKSGI